VLEFTGMPPAHRVGDRALNPADAHGCPACPHPVVGPALKGSPDVFVNGRPLMRIGDPGAHAACCAANSWKVARGSRTVRVNGIAPARTGDGTSHCGGSGTVIEGSPNVLIGDDGGAAPPAPPPPPPPEPVLVEAWPASARVYVNLDPDEARKHGRTYTVRARVEPPRAGVTVHFRLPEVEGNAREDLEPGSTASLASAQAATDGEGVATTRVQVSSNAGDRVQAAASLEPGDEAGQVDTGLLEVWRKLAFDVIEMEQPPEGLYTRLFPKRWRLEDDLAQAIPGLEEVYVELVDTGRRYRGEFRPSLRLEEAHEWCKAVVPPGPSSGEVPVVHLAVVSALVGGGHQLGERAVVSSAVGTHEGGVYTFTLREPPYAEPDGRLVLKPNPGAWITNPNVTGVAGYPSSLDPPGAAFELRLKGPLGSREVVLDLSRGRLPPRLAPGGGFPDALELVAHYYGIVEIAGYCAGEGQYVIVSESYEGDTLVHELGHAFGLAGGVDTHDGRNHCRDLGCTMFFAERPGLSNRFHGGPQPAKGTCAQWVRRLDMSREHLYERWWGGGWPRYDRRGVSDAEGCPCTGK